PVLPAAGGHRGRLPPAHARPQPPLGHCHAADPGLPGDRAAVPRLHRPKAISRQRSAFRRTTLDLGLPFRQAADHAPLLAMKLGVRLESLDRPVRQGLTEAQRLGLAGVQVDAVGDLAPGRLSDTGRREFRHLLRSFGLELTALGGPLRHGLDTPLNLEPGIDRIRQVLDLSYDLGARRVIVEAGRIPDDLDDPRAATLTETLLALGQHGDRTGTVLALETGLESGEVLNKFLERL